MNAVARITWVHEGGWGIGVVIWKYGHKNNQVILENTP